MKLRDYCTLALDKILGVYIGDCCKQHDEDWRNERDKFKSDRYFRECISATFRVADSKAMRVIGRRGRVFCGAVVGYSYWGAVSTLGWFFWWWGKIKRRFKAWKQETSNII